ncbi:16S rRNA (guanine(527)-N(7))-methyltransferase RsmG [Microbacterium sp. MPKO10]|uniref:16S rRNA (guanine(527)-N(7))-methyltransferase RsmG n=1 Tax=Microbacterium sp. MPKO10 TaxID=2989818 RepID=UPI0022361EDF|nr:16S rRNA (guanine(527)-N(7))-methyltransferase RsmG [Microbacterium sp. MPKO10]MCW4457335.1 16S rRNA (guanine(527)-N(7))-methyltransferase RsmG [Microbacterium sp. MPKO10]
MTESLDHSPALEREPAEASVVFGERLTVVRHFTESLARHGEERGLIGPLELPRLWTRHILNSGVLSPLVRPGHLGDVGSGAGLPGLVLAIARPDVHVTLIEPMERRVNWLSEQVEELELDNVSVVRARGEDAVLPQPLDQVTARAVSALRKLLKVTAPLVRDGGELLLLKGANAQAEIDAAQKELRKFRISRPRVELIGEGVIAEPTRVIRGDVRA